LLAIVFAAATALYTYFLMAARQSSQLPSVELGLDYPFKSEDRAFDATVLGLFEKWDCTSGEISLCPGDLLAIFSDGVTEAMRGEEEFGESRLLDDLRAARMLPLEEVVSAVFRDVQQFSAGEQSDDLTLVVARGKQASGC